MITSLELWPETTAIRIDRNKNRLNMVSAVQVAGLIMAYEQAAGAVYNTQNDVSETRETLEAEYNRLFQDSIINPDLIQSMPRTRVAVERVRKIALEVLEQKQQQAYILVDVEQLTSKSSLFVTHNYYAEDFLTSEQLEEKRQVVRGLNSEQKANALYGTITVIQAQ